MIEQFELVSDTDPILTKQVELFDFNNPPTDPRQLAIDMVNFMRDQNGIGLSANQIGLPYRVFVMEGEPAYACFNPRIVVQGEELVLLEEGCLTFPKLYVKVKRSKSIKVRFNGPDGDVYTKTFTGMTARVFQHELDHLNGVHFIRRASHIHKEQALTKWKKWKRKNK